MTGAGRASGLPIRAEAEVLENRSIGGGGFRLVMGVPHWPGAEPGQFVMLSAGARTAIERTDPLLPRPMAVYRGHLAPEAAVAAEPARVEVLYSVVGRGTGLLAEALPGQRVRLVGPLGQPFPAIEAGSRVILVGGGTGIASLYELARRAATSADVAVILGARSLAALMGQDDFAALGVELTLTTEDGSGGLRGRVTDALASRLAAGGVAAVFACGPTPMMRACAELADGVGARCIVSLENNMACGFGVCLGCAVPTTDRGFSLVCRDGPVYDAASVHWDGLP